jgi:hypothetical protein
VRRCSDDLGQSLCVASIGILHRPVFHKFNVVMLMLQLTGASATACIASIVTEALVARPATTRVLPESHAILLSDRVSTCPVDAGRMAKSRSV